MAKPEFSESVKCFDQHYALELTLLYPGRSKTLRRGRICVAMAGFARSREAGLETDAFVIRKEWRWCGSRGTHMLPRMRFGKMKY